MGVTPFLIDDFLLAIDALVVSVDRCQLPVEIRRKIK
jgi:hypothetical protein